MNKKRALLEQIKKTGWLLNFENAQKRNWFTIKEKDMSIDWTKCAVGEIFGVGGDPDKDDIIEMFGKEIYDLGCEFWKAVKTDRVNDAINIYAKIQQKTSVTEGSS